MQSNEWAERKDSLASLYHMIRSGRVFRYKTYSFSLNKITKYDFNLVLMN